MVPKFLCTLRRPAPAARAPVIMLEGSPYVSDVDHLLGVVQTQEPLEILSVGLEL